MMMTFQVLCLCRRASKMCVYKRMRAMTNPGFYLKLESSFP